MSKPSEFVSIGEIAQQSGLRPSALRYYESVGLLPAPQRISGQRRYDAGVLKQIAFIQAAQNTGFTLKEILTLLGVPNTEMPYAERLQVLAKRKLVEVEALIAHATAMKRVLEAGLACQCAQPEDCLLFMPDAK